MREDKAKALTIKNLSYAYRSQWLLKATPAISDLCLELDQGEAFGFLGHNGAGKTTTIKCILNLIQPQNGEIQILGRDHRLPEARASVGYLAEQPYFYDHLSVHEIMELYAGLAGVPSALRKVKIDHALERLSLGERRNARMRSLSKGLTQRVAMAQAIVGEPKLLILDEPFSGLDPIGRKEFKDLVLDLKRAGITIFMSSHVLGDVELICDRVSIAVKGELKGVWKVKQLRESSSERFELLLRKLPQNDPILARLAKDLDQSEAFTRATFDSRASANQALEYALSTGAQIDAFQVAHESLEELFVRIVKQA